MAIDVHDSGVEIKGRNVKFNESKAWIKDMRSNTEYSGTYMVPVEEMAENIGIYDNKELKRLLAKYSARANHDEESDDMEDEMEEISEEVARTVIDEGPYVCANCFSLTSSWDGMRSGLYTNIYCSDCS